MVYTIVSFEGTQGTGKTTAMVASMIEDQKRTGRPIISNNKVNVQNWQKFSMDWLKENIAGDTIEDMIFGWDESYESMDSRDHGTNTNKFMTHFIVQTRKRGVDLYLCTHYIGNIDIRLQRAIDIRGAVNTMVRICPKCRCKSCHGTGFVKGGTPCLECNGKGGMGCDHNGEVCPECLGYGKIGTTVMNFLNRRVRTYPTNWPWISVDRIGMPFPKRPRPIAIFANEYWDKFDTSERVPMVKKLLDRVITEEVAL